MSADADSQSFKERMVAEIKKIQDELNELKNLKVSISKKPARKTTKRKTAAKKKTVKRKPARKTTKRKTAAKKKTVKRKVVRKASKSKKKARRR